ncbi:Carbamoyl-phosphate synthase small chain [Nitrincola nitratireducens]|uniref:carbamoyl-phosphate synthase (glutamine-hydrolyzing) n=1 Tax=Nitrincola nitratireducens TaxID=1229521 RepID=W9UX17_9GAMM|nr:Carbamoyl-phosphate synthase small chain [Nitrincola nitratireducens]
MTRPAILALEDGSIFRGIAIGANGETTGEVVFNTSMTGYQEILTDPSYCRQIVTLTYPHIGNTGINSEDQESNHIWVSGLVIRDLPLMASNFRSEMALDTYLSEKGVIAIADIDTRRLTRLLREKGSLNGCIMAGDIVDESIAVEKAKAFPGLKGMDLAKEVTVDHSYEWTSGEWKLGVGHVSHDDREHEFHVVAYDYGVKHNILRMLASAGVN